MILPIGDQPNPRGFAVVNWALILANAGIFLFVALPMMGERADPNDPATHAFLRLLRERHPDVPFFALMRHGLANLTAYDVFLTQWGYRPADPSLATLLTSMFLHGGWLHLIGNLLFLWIYGDNVEDRLGRFGYLLAYLATGAAATLGYSAFAPASAGQVPMVGASGAISGVLGFYFLWFPENRVRLLVFLFPLYVNVVLVPARLVLGFYLVVENLLPFLLLDPAMDSGVAHGAHIGGFLAGLVVAVGLRSWGAPPPAVRQPTGAATAPAAAAVSVATAPSTAEACARLLQRGQWAAAAHTYLALQLGERRRIPLAAVLTLGEALAERTLFDLAAGVLGRAIEAHPRDPDVARAFLGIGLVLLYGAGRPTAAHSFLLDALDAASDPQVAQAARAALADVARAQAGPRRPKD
jgi:membrane associated rhomboid family serine protease